LSLVVAFTPRPYAVWGTAGLLQEKVLELQNWSGEFWKEHLWLLSGIKGRFVVRAYGSFAILAELAVPSESGRVEIICF
jgi:hypothetical protein